MLATYNGKVTCCSPALVRVDLPCSNVLVSRTILNMAKRVVHCKRSSVRELCDAGVGKGLQPNEIFISMNQGSLLGFLEKIVTQKYVKAAQFVCSTTLDQANA